MKRVVAVVYLLTLSTFCLASSIPQSQGPSNPSTKLDEHQARKELEAVFAELVPALKAKDKAKIKSYYAPDFSIKLPHGPVMGLKEFEKIFPLTEGAPFQITELTMNIERLKLKENEAVLGVKQSLTYRQVLKDGTTAETVQRERRQETWVKTPEGWKLRLIDKVGLKKPQTAVGGEKAKHAIHPPAAYLQTQTPNPEDAPILQNGKALVFIYRLEGSAGRAVPVFCDDLELAQLKRGFYFKVKLDPGRHTFRSEKGDPVFLNVEAGRIYYLAVKGVVQFPLTRGIVEQDETLVGPQAYRLPSSLKMRPIKSGDVKDRSKVLLGQ